MFAGAAESSALTCPAMLNASKVWDEDHMDIVRLKVQPPQSNGSTVNEECTWLLQAPPGHVSFIFFVPCIKAQAGTSYWVGGRGGG